MKQQHETQSAHVNPASVSVSVNLFLGLKHDKEKRVKERVPTSHCFRQMSMFLRCAFEKWSHAFCLVAAVKTAVICSTLGEQGESRQDKPFM